MKNLHGSFNGGNNTIDIVTYKGKIVITEKLHKYAVKWYHTNILNTGPDRMEWMIGQNLYWIGII